MREITPLFLRVKSKNPITSIQPRFDIKKPESEYINAFLVKITTSDGQIGFGEGICTFAAFGTRVNTGHILSRIIEELVSPVLIGREPEDCEEIYNEIVRTLGFEAVNGLLLHALSAVDIALWDLKGKNAGMPICKLIQESPKDVINTYVSKLTGISGKEDVEMYTSSLGRIIKDGYKGVKIGGGLGVENDIDSVRIAREIGGEKLDLMLDVFGGYNVNDAIKLSHSLKPFNTKWLEAPINPNDRKGILEVGSQGSTRIALDPIFSRWYYRDFLISGGSMIGLVDVTRDGGISEFKKFEEVASILGGDLTTHSGWAVSSIGVLASAQVAAAFERVGLMECRLQFEDNPLGNGILRRPIRIKNGVLNIPNGPGLGIDIDEDRLENLLRNSPK